MAMGVGAGCSGALVRCGLGVYRRETGKRAAADEIRSVVGAAVK